MSPCLKCPCYNIVDYCNNDFIYDCTADEWQMEYICDKWNKLELSGEDDGSFECQIFHPD